MTRNGPPVAAHGQHPTVFVVDDNEALARNLAWLLQSVQIPVETFGSAQAFLDALDAQRPGCLLLDVRMPGMSGLDLQKQLVAQGLLLPIIFITGHGDVQMAMRAVRLGAFDFIEKPFDEQDLLDRIHQALRCDARLRARQHERQALQALFASLTPREQEVLGLVVQGQSNKAIAKVLDLSAKTIEVHRASMMAKMRAHSVADVVRLAMQQQMLASPAGLPGSHG